jgi:GcrA cell cycle regulator
MAYDPSPRTSAVPNAGSASSNGWSDARVERLRSLWSDEALSASEIACRLGTTRNAVLGKVHRLGLSNRRPAGAPVIVAPRTPQPPRPLTTRRSEASPPPVTARALPRPEIGPGLVDHLEDLHGSTCHWPVGDPREDSFSFCGRDALRPPYCEDHRRVAYRPGGPRPVTGLIRRFARA